MTSHKKNTTPSQVRIQANLLDKQIRAILSAWGMPEKIIEPTVYTMVETDLRGIDSHGIGMIMRYEEYLQKGLLNIHPNIEILRETPAVAQITGDAGLGHAPSVKAIEMACDKAEQLGVGIVSVTNSMHHGAVGAYALRAARRGMIGFGCTAAWAHCIPPTRSKDAMFATNPIAFAAPAGKNRHFVMDFATSTVAVGKISIAWFNDRPLPPGWVIDAEGQSVTDPAIAHPLCTKERQGGLTPLGGTEEMSSHKGYGLAAMVEILSTILSGAVYGPALIRRNSNAANTMSGGHFFMALKPEFFREPGDFQKDLDEMIDALHAATPIDPQKPVLVHGDNEWAHFDDRKKNGIPVPLKLLGLIKGVADRAGVDFLLGEVSENSPSLWGAD